MSKRSQLLLCCTYRVCNWHASTNTRRTLIINDKVKCTVNNTNDFYWRVNSFIGGYLSLSRQIHAYKSRINDDLEEIFRYKDTSISNWIIETKVRSLCSTYVRLSKHDKNEFLRNIAVNYSSDHANIRQLAQKLLSVEPANNERQLIARERSMRDALTPRYQWLFILMGRLEHGVKFLVDLRADVLQLIFEISASNPNENVVIQQLNKNLHHLLLLWFSVGFLYLERITWQSSCEMLEKISDYEAIHPIRNWVDLKRRVGPYRRCYVFTHPSMPREPLVVLHTALCDLIPESVKGIEEAQNRIMSESKGPTFRENKGKIKAAIFYSIASTQKGLKGIDLGNYMIKEVAKEVTREFPTIEWLSTLSPIPNFKCWFLDRLKQDSMIMFSDEEEKALKRILDCQDTPKALRQILSNSLWTKDDNIANILKDPLTRLCAWYLFKEKRRNYALDSVANFHLRNGAIMWRINWLADPSPRGAQNSCGIMVNYRYILDETEFNSRNYIEKNLIKASESVLDLVDKAGNLAPE